jgi:hypothetical protein
MVLATAVVTGETPYIRTKRVWASILCIVNMSSETHTP